MKLIAIFFLPCLLISCNTPKSPEDIATEYVRAFSMQDVEFINKYSSTRYLAYINDSANAKQKEIPLTGKDKNLFKYEPIKVISKYIKNDSSVILLRTTYKRTAADGRNLSNDETVFLIRKNNEWKVDLIIQNWLTKPIENKMPTTDTLLHSISSFDTAK